MASLRFIYSSMNAGKSSQLLQVAYNYRERGMNPLIMKPAIDNRDSSGEVVSRIGLRADAVTFQDVDSLVDIIFRLYPETPPDAILVDESQFMTPKQVDELAWFVDELEVPVMCYGLRTDFAGNLFPGSQRLLAIADKLIELKGICHCGRKATMVARIDKDGNKVNGGEQIAVGAEDMYVSLCRKHYNSDILR